MRKFLLMVMAVGHAALAGAGNVLSNPGFEAAAGMTGWVSFGGAPSLQLSTLNRHGGARSALIAARTAPYMGIARDIRNLVQAGKGHDLRIWVRTHQNLAATYELGIKRVDAAGTHYLSLDRRTLAPGKWVKLGGYYRHEPSGETSLLQLYVNGPDAGVAFFVDDARLEPPPVYTPATTVADSEFVRASGRDLVTGNPATVLRLLGTNFFAYGDEGDSVDSVLGAKRFDREDYAAVKAAGMNVVRLNLWFRLFEDDAAPYQYKQEGWDWLNKQIVWAHMAGVRLILDMHAPPCGFQGPEYTGAFWSGGEAYGSCQDRLKAIWAEIARRYQNEPVIASYDLLNEPNPQNQAQWGAYAQVLTDFIRIHDSRHLVQVESCFASDCQTPPLLNDSNVLYDVHHYDHWLHSSQLSYGGNLGDSNMRYGDASSKALPWATDTTPGVLLENDPIPLGNTLWRRYTGKLFTHTRSDSIAAMPVFIAHANSGKISFDDFQVIEYAPDGKQVRVIQNIDMEKRPANPYLLESYVPYLAFTDNTRTQRLSGKEGSRIIENSGHRGSASISISAADGQFLVTMPHLTFSLRQGYRYRISGWIKGTNVTGGSGAMGLQLQKHRAYVTPVAYDKAYLEQSLLDAGVQFSLDHNVPLNLGEFGQSPRNYTAARGGLAWMRDTLDLMAQYGISGQNWDWHSNAWGLYSNVYGYPDADALNRPLLQLFRAQKTGAP